MLAGLAMLIAAGCGNGGGGDVAPFEPECWEGTAAEQKADCDDGDPTTADRCAIASEAGGICAHVPVDCDALDPIKVSAELCGREHPSPCASWRCRGNNTCLRIAIANCPF